MTINRVFYTSRKLAESLSTPVIVSGGVSSLDDVKNIAGHEISGIEGMVIGRALYDKVAEWKGFIVYSHELA